MGIFDKKKSISRTELRETFKKHSGRIPGTGGKKYFRQEREKIFRKRVGEKYGSQISKDEFRRIMRDLKSDRAKAKTSQEKRERSQELRYWKEEIGGKNV